MENIRKHLFLIFAISSVIFSLVAVIISSFSSNKWSMSTSEVISVASILLTLAIAMLTFVVQIRQHALTEQMKMLQESYNNMTKEKNDYEMRDDRKKIYDYLYLVVTSRSNDKITADIMLRDSSKVYSLFSNYPVIVKSIQDIVLFRRIVIFDYHKIKENNDIGITDNSTIKADIAQNAHKILAIWKEVKERFSFIGFTEYNDTI